MVSKLLLQIFPLSPFSRDRCAVGPRKSFITMLQKKIVLYWCAGGTAGDDPPRPLRDPGPLALRHQPVPGGRRHGTLIKRVVRPRNNINVFNLCTEYF